MGCCKLRLPLASPGERAIARYCATISSRSNYAYVSESSCVAWTSRAAHLRGNCRAGGSQLLFAPLMRGVSPAARVKFRAVLIKATCEKA